VVSNVAKGALPAQYRSPGHRLFCAESGRPGNPTPSMATHLMPKSYTHWQDGAVLRIERPDSFPSGDVSLD
jgi:hypothetical protein